jgi:hypothetical protein
MPEGLSAIWHFIHSAYRFTTPGGWRVNFGRIGTGGEDDGDSRRVPDGRENAVP